MSLQFRVATTKYCLQCLHTRECPLREDHVTSKYKLSEMTLVYEGGLNMIIILQISITYIFYINRYTPQFYHIHKSMTQAMLGTQYSMNKKYADA